MSSAEGEAPRTPPPLPGFLQAVAAVAQLQLRRLVRGKKLRLAVVTTFAVVATILVGHYAGAPSEGLSADYAVQRAQASLSEGLRWGFFRLLVFLLPFLLASASIGEEVEQRTFVFLSSRPSGRAAVALGKWVAATSATVTILVVAVLILHVGAFATSPRAMVEAVTVDGVAGTGSALLALVLLSTAYCSICLFFGALVPEAAGVSSALYLAVIEFLFSFLPSIFRAISLNYSAQEIAGFERDGMFAEDAIAIAPPVAGAALLAAGLLFGALAVIVVHTSEYRFSQS
ncbi:MAG: ABC transporter permease subunit [Myxococcota bacterium]